MKKYKKIILIPDCAVCPESYTAHYGGTVIGYLRIRYGQFSAQFGFDTVYRKIFKNDPYKGMFDTDEERKKYLKKAKKAIYKAMVKKS